MSTFYKYYNSSIGKKQIVAASGLLILLFVVGHLAGNMTFFLGPEAFNHYADKLAGFRPALNVVELGLLTIFVFHVFTTALVVIENRKARLNQYKVKKDTQRSLSTKLMPLTGIIIFIFIIYHLIDFTFADKHSSMSILADGKDYGLYGLVYNSFSNPIHSMFYVIAMFCIGLHLSHGIQSFCQSFGWINPENDKKMKKFSAYAGLFIALLYSSIPLSVLIQNY